MTTETKRNNGLTFIVKTDAWYASAVGGDPDILLAVDGEGAGMIRERSEPGVSGALTFELFDDGWRPFAELQARVGNLFAELQGLGDNPTLAAVADCLRELGFKDVTPRENPHERRSA